MTGDEMRRLADERRALLASKGINVRIRSVARAERTALEEAILARQGWVGRAADLNCTEAEVQDALQMVERLNERIESLS